MEISEPVGEYKQPLAGWVKLHRRIVEWEWYGDTNTFRVFLHLLLTANISDKRYRGILIPKGSTVTGYSKLAETLDMTEQNARTAIKHLKSTGEVTTKVTSKFSVVTIVKWEEYQLIETELTSKLTNNLTGIQQASNRHLTAPREVKKIRSKEEYKETNKEKIGVGFWKLEIENFKDEKDILKYKGLFEYLVEKKANHLFSLRDQLSFLEYQKGKKYCAANNVNFKDVIDAMINNPKKIEGKVSFNLTFRSWALLRLKK